MSLDIQEKCPVSGESPGEERINHLTHLCGLGLSVAGALALVICAFFSHKGLNIVGCLVYSMTLVLVYAASTYYHGCPCIRKKRILKIVDHACIYLLIAGTYTPFTLGPLLNNGGVTLLGIEWGVALIGILFKIIAVDRFDFLFTIGYLVMGWLILFSMPTLFLEASFFSVTWLFVGGFFYSVGTIFYLWDRVPFNHAIWHIFVLLGSASHYFSILALVLV